MTSSGGGTGDGDGGTSGSSRSPRRFESASEERAHAAQREADAALTDDLRRLRALAAGLCQDARVGVDVAPGPWAFDRASRTFIVSAEDLRAAGVDYCAAVLARQVGHAKISRHGLLEIAFADEELGRLCVDALEVGRADAWIGDRFPGARAWLERLDEQGEPIDPALPDVVAFAIACAAPMSGRFGVRASVAQALADTFEARQAYASFAPKATGTPPTTAARARFRLEVAPQLPKGLLPPAAEQATLLAASAALRHAAAEILPVAEALYWDDVDAMQAYLMERPDRIPWARQRLEANDAIAVMRQLRRRGPLTPPQQGWVEELAQALVASAALAALPRRVLIREGLPEAGGRDADATADPGPRPSIWTPPTPYERALERLRDQVEALCRRLEAALLPSRRLRRRDGFPSGRGIDLRRLFAFEADPRRVGELWWRPTIPDRRDVAVLLLVDLSGSMSGAKAEAALLGTVLLAETLDRLNVPFAIQGFQDVLVPLCGFVQPFDDAARSAIGEIPQEIEGRRLGGNNSPSYNDDGPCLLEAAGSLLGQSALQRLLIVVSDGRPEGRRSLPKDLSAAVATVCSADPSLMLVGLGLGPQTEHVRQYYPNATANVAVDRLADEIADRLERVLLDHLRTGGAGPHPGTSRH